MIHFVLCGHGSYGSSLKESMEMFLPEMFDVEVIDFTKQMDTSELTDTVKCVIEEHQQNDILFVCDIVGGAPFKVCAIESLNHSNVGVIGGTNLAGLLEICFMRESDLQEVMKKAVEVTQTSVEFLPR